MINNKNEFNYSIKNSLLWGNFAAHCKETQKGPLQNRIVHGVLAAIEFLPVIGQFSSLIELGIFKIKNPSHRKEDPERIEMTVLVRQAC